MRVRVLYFGVLRDIFQDQSERVELQYGATVSSLLQVLRERAPERDGLWSSLAVAVNQEYADAECVLCDGDDVALLPPVSGGKEMKATPRFFASPRMTTFAGL